MPFIPGHFVIKLIIAACGHYDLKRKARVVGDVEVIHHTGDPFASYREHQRQIRIQPVFFPQLGLIHPDLSQLRPDRDPGADDMLRIASELDGVHPDFIRGNTDAVR